MALANLSTYYTWKSIKSEYNNIKFKISAPTWNDEFNLPDGVLLLIYKIILNTSSKNMKLFQIILLYKFM